MSKKYALIAFMVWAFLSLPFSGWQQAAAQIGATEQTQTQAAADLTATAEASTPTMQVPERPIVVIESYYINKDTISVGSSFTLFVTLRNKGDEPASNVVLSLLNDDFLPSQGGVVAVGEILSSQGGATPARTVTQDFIVSNNLAWKTTGVIPAAVAYTGPDGATYSENFSITLGLFISSSAYATATPTPTSTSAPVVRPQLVVSEVQKDVDPLQPGSIFNLTVKLRNLGNADAKAASMVLGGAASTSTDVNGTPQPGGISASGGDLVNFAPLDSSNVFYLGDVAMGAEAQITARLIVNVAAAPGAYSVKLSFVYNDPNGARVIDDQAITLLVFQMPNVEVSFYRDPGPIMANQMTILPVQVVNLGKKATVLGNLTITAAEGELSNATMLIGSLETGGSTSADINFTPYTAGEQTLKAVISYTDDFNQPRTIEQDIRITVMEMPEAPPMELTPGASGMEGGMEPTPVNETAWQKIVRFFRGLLGLGSDSTIQPGGGMQDQPMPEDDMNYGGGPVKGP